MATSTTGNFTLLNHKYYRNEQLLFINKIDDAFWYGMITVDDVLSDNKDKEQEEQNDDDQDYDLNQTLQLKCIEY